MNTAGQEAGYGDVFEFETASAGDATAAGLPGLRQVYVTSGVGGGDNFDVFDPDDSRWTTEVVPGAVMARYSNNGNGGIGDGAGEKRTYTAPSGNTYTWTPTAVTYYYEGYMFVEAGHVYNFFEAEYDYARIDVGGTTMTRNTNWGSASTGSYAAEATGWVPIKVWLGGSGGNTGAANGFNYGVGWNEDGTTTASGDCAGWSTIENVDGEPVRFCIVPARTPDIVGADFDASSATLDVAVPGGVGTATVLAVWNATDLGDSADTNDWAGCAVLGTVGAAADTVSGTVSLDPAATPVVRAVVADASGVYWSAPFLLGSAVDPVIGPASAAADGDTLAVSGSMVSTGSGNGFALQLLVGYGADAVATATNAVAVGSDGTFAIDAEVLPGTNGWWKLLARTSDGGYDATLPAAFATKAGSVLRDAASTSVSHHTVTFTGTLDVLGAGETTATVWAGTDPTNLVAVAASSKTLRGTGSFQLTATFPGDPHDVYWKIVAVNVAPGGTTWTSETSVSAEPVQTLDSGIYTWKSSVAEGDWDNPANWDVSGVDANDCLGYPNTAQAQVRFTAGTTATVRVTDEFTFKDMDLKRKDLVVTFAGTNAASCRITGNVYNTGANLDDRTDVSNTRIVFSGVTVYDTSDAFNWGTGVSENSVLRFENGAVLSLDGWMHLFGTNTWVEAVGGSRLEWRRLTVEAGFDVGCYGGGVKLDDSRMDLPHFIPQRYVKTVGDEQHVDFSGDSQLRCYTYLRTWNNDQDYMTNDLVFAFAVPAGGWGDYSAAPLYANYQGNNVENKRLGWRDANRVNGGKLVMRVDPKSPAFKTGRTLNHVQLVSWLAGIDEKSVRLEDAATPSGTVWARTFYTYGWPTGRTEPSFAGEVPTGVAAEVKGQGGTLLIFW